jgi:hypothetical protein
MSGRRVSFLAAGVLSAASLALPLWGFRMSAPQYPGEALHLRVTRTAITGDVHEITTLQKYVGVRFPQQIPELKWLARGIATLSLLLIVAGIAGDRSLGRILRRAAAVLLLLFLAVSAALLQKRLYDVGHVRDPHAPMRSMRNFTPPAVGPVHVGNFTVWSYPHAGGLALAAAGLLALTGACVRRPQVAGGTAR